MPRRTDVGGAADRRYEGLRDKPVLFQNDKNIKDEKIKEKVRINENIW
ncbi:hypothetical protein RUMHYD_02971 [Blautia hydrogenotrophica DSM 10507]|uniref:Uncharacterized protein n=1 Tax=Blautia hydrogenotrophica (strain DSM 10507 / JCM 14656 / S5a33) TaxID=476272 RepID=C0CQ19_BLAHS|nr:hypothetical protein RUMHYD_02971 [Blautia hydrogenotrophica DSM 10507]